VQVASTPPCIRDPTLLRDQASTRRFTVYSKNLKNLAVYPMLYTAIVALK